MSDKMSEKWSQYQKLFQKDSERMSEYMSDQLSDETPESRAWWGSLDVKQTWCVLHLLFSTMLHMFKCLIIFRPLGSAVLVPPRRHEAFLHRVPLGQRGGYAGAARAAAAGAGAPSRAFDPAAGDSGAAGRAQVAGCGE